MKNLVDTLWQSIDGRVFQITDVQGDWVWYVRNENTYSCLLEAFKQRFRLMENEQYDRR